MKKVLIGLMVVALLGAVAAGQIVQGYDPDFGDFLRLQDGDELQFGAGGPFTMLHEAADANANYLCIDLPAGGAVDVPVLGLGIGLDGVDLGLFNGLTQPTFGVVDADRDSAVYVSFSADDTGLLAGKGSATSFGITFATLTNTCSTTIINYTPAYLIGYDSGAYMSIAVADTTGNVTITHAGGTKAVAWTAAGGFTLTGAVSIVGALSASSITGYAIGTDVQAYDAELAALAALTFADDKIILGTGAGTIAMADCTAFAQTILDDADAAAVRTTLSLVPGTNVQAYDAELAALAALTFADDKIILGTGAGTIAMADCSAFAQTVLDDADAATAQATLGVLIGTNVQAYDADLTTYAGITPTAAAQTALGNAADAIVLSQRHRVTVAEINAGHTILPAITGKSYRIIDFIAIAYGGAVGTTTTVDILGTQSAGSVKLVTFAQANLTQSSPLTIGSTGVSLQADGASFVACDANTAITVGKTGGDADTATGVDFIITYVIE